MKLIAHEVLAKYMATRGETDQTLAGRVAVPPALIGRLRRGESAECTGDLGARIEKALNAPPGSLFVRLLGGSPVVALIAHEVLAKYMADRRETCRSLADKVDTSRSTISDLRLGKKPTCKQDLGVRIEKALNAPPGSLFDATGFFLLEMDRGSQSANRKEAA